MPLLARLASAPLALAVEGMMPAERIAMRQVRDVLRLKAAGVPGNEIARRLNVAGHVLRQKGKYFQHLS